MTGSTRPNAMARRERSAAISRLSTDCTVSKVSTAARALFPCRWPIRCQSISSPARLGDLLFASASWTRVSPKAVCPARARARMAPPSELLLAARWRGGSVTRRLVEHGYGRRADRRVISPERRQLGILEVAPAHAVDVGLGEVCLEQLLP